MDAKVAANVIPRHVKHVRFHKLCLSLKLSPLQHFLSMTSETIASAWKVVDTLLQTSIRWSRGCDK